MEAALLRSERERVRESESVFKVRAEANAKIKQLRSMIQVRKEHRPNSKCIKMFTDTFYWHIPLFFYKLTVLLIILKFKV